MNAKDEISGTNSTDERIIHDMSGWTMLTINLLMYASAIGLLVWFIFGAVAADKAHQIPNFWPLIGMVVTLLASIFVSVGFFTLQPNQASVLMLFGHYVGSVHEDGFHWTNPFNSKRRVSLRSRNFNSDPLKVNDKGGNPIEIGAVVVWKVLNSAHATFDVEDYEEFREVVQRAAANTTDFISFSRGRSS